MARPTPSKSEGNEEPVSPQMVPAALSHSAGFLLSYCGKILRERCQNSLAPLNLSLKELGVMRILGSEGALSQQELGRRHLIDRSSLVQLIDQLEQREFVVRSTNQEDRRSKLIFLTPRGRKTLQKAIRLVEREEKDFLQVLGDSESKVLKVTLLSLLERNLRALGPESK